MKESDRGHLKIGSCCSNLHPNTYLSVTGEHQKVLVEALEFPVLILNAALKSEREREALQLPAKELPNSTYVQIRERCWILIEKDTEPVNLITKSYNNNKGNC